MSLEPSLPPVSSPAHYKKLLIKCIISAVIIGFFFSLITSASLAYHYYHKNISGTLYYLSDDITKELVVFNYLKMVLPTILITQGVLFLILIVVAFVLFKISTAPLRPIEQWLHLFLQGDFTHELDQKGSVIPSIQEKTSAITKNYHTVFAEIDKSIETIKKEKGSHSPCIEQEIDRVENLLRTIKYKN